MNAINKPPKLRTNSSLMLGNLEYGQVTQCSKDIITLDDELSAKPADSLGIELEQGDIVAFLRTDGDNFIVSLLKAAPRDDAVLAYRFAPHLKLNAGKIELNASTSVALKSMHEISLETCKNVRISCRNLVQNAFESTVMITRQWVQNCRSGSIKADELLHCDAGSQIITADRDLRLDAERINMG